MQKLSNNSAPMGYSRFKQKIKRCSLSTADLWIQAMITKEQLCCNEPSSPSLGGVVFSFVTRSQLLSL
uniref:Uncharacterized protein n=1 Tax=Manihot esculenta TaxID=3983 RepID=A0A2C9V4W4_MANES